MLWEKTPDWIQKAWHKRLWRVPTDEKLLYLTFDDGPTPEVTPAVAALLAQYDAKGTFFLVGQNLERHPEIAADLLAQGHRLGNHTHRHLNGWKTPAEAYLADTAEAQQAFGTLLGIQPRLFRPPYGKAGRKAAQALRAHYELVMWDIMPGDFEPGKQPDAVASHVIRHAGPGSIVVLHDSQKCRENVLGALPRILAHFAAEGYRFAALPEGHGRQLRH